MKDSKDKIEHGDITPAPEGSAISDGAAAKVVGGLSFKGGSPPKPSKGTYIPAPPALQVPVPYPSGM